MNPLFVGIDVSSKNNVAYLMKPDGSKHSSFSVQNNLGGAKLLSERIVSALGSMQLERVVIGLEATSIYGDSLVYALREDGRLGRFQRKIHVLNPKQVRKFKEAYSDLPKNDWVDAFVIADHLRFGRINREVYMDDYRYKALQTLTRARFDVIQNLTREKQRFANYLFLKCSGMAQDKDIQNTSATTIALMEHFETVDDFLLFPRTGIIGSACNRLLEQPVLVAIMDGQMRLMNCGDQKLGIEDDPSSLPNILRADRVHVVDEWPAVNLPSGNSQITPHVPGNHNIPDLLPLRGAIKDLIHVPVKAEGLLSDSTVQTKIAVALLEGGEKDQFRVTSNTHPRPPRPARCTA